jgi:uncharacterized membrane protein
MIDGWLLVLTLVTALGCGLIAGVFFAFSTFVMKALARLPAADGLAAMQAINVEAPTAWFMTGLFGTAVACVAVAVAALFRLDEPYAAYLLIGTLLYLVGTIVLTIVYHVPRNDALARVDPDGPDAAGHWTRYVATWTAGNHVRAVAALAAAAVLTVALRVG